MTDLIVNRLQLHISNASGNEHRMRPIASRAATIFANKLGERLLRPKDEVRSLSFERLIAAPLHFDLRLISNEQAASAVASAWLDALGKQLKA